jgi:hypothetical protein
MKKYNSQENHSFPWYTASNVQLFIDKSGLRLTEWKWRRKLFQRSKGLQEPFS